MDPAFTEAETTVWHAAYGAAFATKFEDAVAADEYGYAARTLTADYAVTVADAAVQRLREWREAHRRPTDPLGITEIC